jgi:iron-sulfur cluster assembly protein
MLQLSPAAIAEIQRLRDRQTTSESASPRGIRLKVVPGGCAGLSYQFTFTAAPIDGDPTYQFDQLTLSLEAASLPYLQSLSIDYADDLMGGNFRFINPQASKICDCGISFSTEPVPESLPERVALEAG